ncbi:glutaredoxin family protein [Candidatus Bathyarchaeota archaeon]|nr:glutaredoxin family protein [Candidatus Bathyarchaeota archaeon]MBS7613268.1 glutaredoxin family protein [Candidatus Bathyarchaeota archaeon]MBS7617659.1 glutaredoxin family protein [Candidatus Bathyarchaeota archaeon]
MKPTVYTTPNCPNCKLLKSFLERLEVAYEEKDLLDLDVQTELIMMDVFTMSAPILKFGRRILTFKELFENGKLNEKLVISILEDEKNG